MATEIRLDITGMTCDHCVNAVTKALVAVPGVSAAKVSLDDKLAVINGAGIDTAKLLEAISEEGYEAAVRA